MKHGSLFSGIGGFDLAAEWMGWENVFHCEWNDFGKRVLHHYWPNALQYDDITKTDFTIHRGGIDILTGGFPCQPYSTSGKRLGKEDERHLWPEMLRAIREIAPRYIVGENVRGLVNWNGGMVFDEVQTDLEAEGYQVIPFLLPACAVNAPHRRDRIWFIAYSTSIRRNGVYDSGQRIQRKNEPCGKTRSGSESKTAKDTNRDGWASEKRQEESDKWKFGNIGTGDNEWIRANNESNWTASDTSSTELQRRKFYGSPRSKKQIESEGRQFSRPIRNQWQNFPTEPPICGGHDGLPSELDGITFSKWRAESIKAYGNAVVPQLVYQIFKAIDQYNKLNLGL
jgi:DNA (cytosine-5)-methyltransferase 1